jgi:hypothetical protein
MNDTPVSWKRGGVIQIRLDPCQLVEDCPADILLQVDYLIGEGLRPTVVSDINHRTRKNGLRVVPEAENIGQRNVDLGADPHEALLLKRVLHWVGRPAIPPTPLARSMWMATFSMSIRSGVDARTGRLSVLCMAAVRGKVA